MVIELPLAQGNWYHKTGFSEWIANTYKEMNRNEKDLDLTIGGKMSLYFLCILAFTVVII